MQPLALMLIQTLQCLENTLKIERKGQKQDTKLHTDNEIRTIEKIGNQETKALTHLPLGCEVMSGFFPPSFFICFPYIFQSVFNTHFYDQRKTQSKSQKKTGSLCRLGFLIIQTGPGNKGLSEANQDCLWSERMKTTT